jgi:zinc protease
LIDQPDAQQATLRVGNLAIAANDPNRYVLEMVNTTLGGSFFSRLNMNLRADKGYTYGVYSDLDRLNEVGAFLISTDVDQEHAGEALQEILNEWETIRTQPFSAQELADKKGLTLGSLALTLEDPVNFAGTLAAYQLTGLPLTELEGYQQGIEGLTSADILKAAATYLSDQPVIVVVGNAELLKPQLEPLGEVVEVE